MRRVVLKSPVLENCTPGSVRGAPGNRRPYLAKMEGSPIFLSSIFLSIATLSMAVTQAGLRPSASCRGGELEIQPANWGVLKPAIAGTSVSPVDSLPRLLPKTGG